MEKMILSRRGLLAGMGATFLIPFPVFADEGEFSIRNKKGSAILNKALFRKNFWKDASKSFYENKPHDEIRLKSMESGGYLTYISGCGQRNFRIEDVATGIFWHQKELHKHMAGAVTCDLLGFGQDPTVKRPFTDTFLLGDFDFFYASYFQRMYRFNLPDGRVVLPFELIGNNFLGAAEWTKYRAAKKKMIAGTETKRRSFMFGDILEMAELYGMYIVEPGKKYDTRVTMVARLQFGGDSWIADFGSKLPFVIRAGLANGFRAHVDIVKKVVSGSYKR